MKQHITECQLEELYKEDKLTDGQSQRFKRLQNEITDNFLYFTDYDEVTIAKMIELLSNRKQIEIIQGGKWWVMFMDKSLKVSGFTLCDALWEAVKEVI